MCKLHHLLTHLLLINCMILCKQNLQQHLTFLASHLSKNTPFVFSVHTCIQLSLFLLDFHKQHHQLQLLLCVHLCQQIFFHYVLVQHFKMVRYVSHCVGILMILCQLFALQKLCYLLPYTELYADGLRFDIIFFHLIDA